MKQLFWLTIFLSSCSFISEEELAFRKGGIAGCDTEWYLDVDQDQYGSGAPTFACSAPGDEYVLAGGDCDDENPNISPGSPEDCSTAFDDDCNGTSNGDGENVLECTIWYADTDGDGFGSDQSYVCDCTSSGIYILTDAGDCDDLDETINPDATEICNDGLDNNCDGLPNDCGFPNPYELTDSRATYVGVADKDYAGSNLAFGRLFSTGDSIVVSASGVGSSDIDLGAVYLIPAGEGTISLDQSSATILGDSGSSFGAALLANEDLNGDGAHDLIIGSPTKSLGNSSSVGAVYAFWGPIDGQLSFSDANALLIGENQDDRFGESVAVGSVTEASQNQLLISSPNYEDRGAVFIYESDLVGQENLSDAELMIEGEVSGDSFGVTIAEIKDLNGDGIGDLSVGASGVNDGKGAAYIFWGPITETMSAGSADVIWTESVSNAGVGTVIETVGDVHGDGYGDLAIGVLSMSKVYVTSTLEAGTYDLSNANNILTGPEDSAAGSSIAYIGDVNGDSGSDLLIGAYIESTAYVLYGPLQGNYDLATEAVQFVDTGSDQVGASVYSAGDVNGDTVNDLLIGAKLSSLSSYNKSGAVFLLQGGGQ
jgi:hypothetical protein